MRADGAHFATCTPPAMPRGRGRSTGGHRPRAPTACSPTSCPAIRASDEPVVPGWRYPGGGRLHAGCAAAQPQRHPRRLHRHPSTASWATPARDHSGPSALTATVRRDGRPVTLQPHLGALGTLVVPRAGDPPTRMYTPTMTTRRDPPSPSPRRPPSGRYLAYFDFQVDGVVRTAAFVLDSAQG